MNSMSYTEKRQKFLAEREIRNEKWRDKYTGLIFAPHPSEIYNIDIINEGFIKYLDRNSIKIKFLLKIRSNLRNFCDKLIKLVDRVALRLV